MLDIKLINQLRLTAEERFNAISGYVKNKTECRVQNLLRYFDEESTICGHCDICVEKNKLELSEKEFDIICIWMKEQLTGNKIMPEELLKLNLPVRKEKVMEALSFLTDNKKIIHTAENLLIWRD